ncbi:MAG TPA: hypothetical protein VMV94_15715 [Phycisphaerae bacterium]|nr:hypothetical protein [Phycisphaerae bacterium]
MTIDKCRRWAFHTAIFAISFSLAGCASPEGQRPEGVQETHGLENAPAGPAVLEGSPAGRATQHEETAAIPAQEPVSGDAYTFAFHFQPDDVTYLLIQDDFSDICGFPPLLTVTTFAKEKRSIIQRVVSMTSEEASSPPGGFPRISWECDRYEIAEGGLKDESSFDSLRDLYPPPSLWQLGGIPGSVCTFLLDPRTGQASEINLRPAQIAGGGGAAKLSKTTERCALTEENLHKLLNDLGSFYFPDSPKRLGDQWTKTYQQDEKAIGIVTTKLTCTLTSVRKVSDRQIATIGLSGEITLRNKAPAPGREAAAGKPDRPAQASQPTQQQYSIDKADCSGTVEFDLTRGELVQAKLHREMEFFAPIETTQQSALVKEIRAGWSQDLRVTVSHTPPIKPVIVGGPKPPVVPEEKKPAPAPTTQKAQPTSYPTSAPTRPVPATRPAMTPSRSPHPTSTRLAPPAPAAGKKPRRPERPGIAPPPPSEVQPTTQPATP